MSSVLDKVEKDQQKLPMDQKDILITEMNGEFQNLDDPHLNECTPEEETIDVKKKTVVSIYDEVSMYGKRNAEFNSGGYNCPVNFRYKTKEKKKTIKAEDINDTKNSYRYGKQVSVNMERLGTDYYLAKGFRDVNGYVVADLKQGVYDGGKAGLLEWEDNYVMKRDLPVKYTTLSW